MTGGKERLRTKNQHRGRWYVLSLNGQTQQQPVLKRPNFTNCILSVKARHSSDCQACLTGLNWQFRNMSSFWVAVYRVGRHRPRVLHLPTEATVTSPYRHEAWVAETVTAGDWRPGVHPTGQLQSPLPAPLGCASPRTESRWFVPTTELPTRRDVCWALCSEPPEGFGTLVWGEPL